MSASETIQLLFRTKQLAGLLRLQSHLQPRNDDISFAKQTVKDLVPKYLSALVPSKRAAFTLAEVLITLGIIGVVATMTIPTIVTSYQKSVVENRVKKFYTLINQTVKMSVVDNGETVNWLPAPNPNPNYDYNLKYLQTYFLPYLKYLKYEECVDNSACVYLSDGTMFSFSVDINGADIRFFVNGKYEKNPRNHFVFQFNKKRALEFDQTFTSQNLVEPYIMGWDGEHATLLDGYFRSCNRNAGMHFCTKLLEQNGWKIPNDYPW